METKKKELLRKKKVAAASSSDSSDSSSSGSEEDSSSSSSSSNARHKGKHRGGIRKRRGESSDSSEGHVKKPSKKHLVRKTSEGLSKKIAHRKLSQSVKVRTKVGASGKKTRSLSPASKLAHKHRLKAKMIAAKKAKAMHPEERELHQREREKLMMRRSRSRTPKSKTRNSRTPLRNSTKKERTPDRRISSPNTRIRVNITNDRRVRSPGRSIKETSVRRHETTKDRERREREAAKEKERAEALARCQERAREREREKLRRMNDRDERSIEEEVGATKERYKHDRLLPRPSERARMLNASRVSPDKHDDRSRSHSRGKIPIRERLDKDYERHERTYQQRRSLSREHEEYAVVQRGQPREETYSRDRPVSREEREPERFEHREERRMPGHEFLQARKNYEERPRRAANWEEERGEERGGNSGRIYEPPPQRTEYREIPPSHNKRTEDSRICCDRPTWNEQQQDKWQKDKDPKEWNKYGDRNWKESPSSHHQHAPSSSTLAPTMVHPRRWPGPSTQAHGEWSSGPPMNKGEPSVEYRRPAPIHPHPRMEHKVEHSPTGPPTTPHTFKRQFSAGSGPNSYNAFNYKRFHFTRRFPSPAGINNPHSKINHHSLIRRPPLAPNATVTSPGASAGGNTPVKNPLETIETPEGITESPGKLEASESGELTTEPSSQSADEVKVEADTTSGNAEMAMDDCEDNLSEFSDVDDEILNREEEMAAREAAELNAQAGEQDEEHSDKKIISKIHANIELKKEMDLDFEEISDGELEEESRNKGFGDALGVDWASLAKETQRPIVRATDETWDSAKSRWTAHRIIWDIGVSVNLAGEEFARKMLTEARDKLRQEKQERRLKLKELLEEKLKPNEIDSEDDLMLEESGDIILHPLAQVQVLMRKMQAKRKNLILNATGKYGRALSMRRDLKIRRHLCHVPTKDVMIDRSCITNVELNAQVDKIYQKLLGQVN
ncbi:unnamed protein product [Diamesa hyperborea]